MKAVMWSVFMLGSVYINMIMLRCVRLFSTVWFVEKARGRGTSEGRGIGKY